MKKRLLIVAVLLGLLFAAAAAAETSGDYQYEVLENGAAALTLYTGNGGTVAIPEELDGHPVTVIGYEAFGGCAKLTEISIPESVTEIKSHAFVRCSSLRDVHIPDSVVSIGFSAFYECASLQTVNLPEALTELEMDTFHGCESLSGVTIPAGVTRIEESCFENCRSLTEIVIPEGVTRIDRAAFKGCVSLRKVTLPSSLTKIGEKVRDRKTKQFVLYSPFEECESVSFVVPRDSEAEEFCKFMEYPYDYPEAAQEIRFLNILWGSDMDTVCRAMLDAGLINEEGVGAIELSKSRKESALERPGRRRRRGYMNMQMGEDGFTIQEDAHENAWDTHIMSSDIADSWMGRDIHNISLYFAMDGDTEKLIGVNVSFKWKQTDLTPELEKTYGGQYLPESSNPYKIWTGANETALVYDTMNLTFAVLNAGEILDASVPKVAATPEPTPEPTPDPPVIGEDLLDYPQEGEYTFLGIPWDSDVQTTIDAMVAQGMITRDARTYNMPNQKTTSQTALTNTEKGWKTIFPSGKDWTGYFFASKDLAKPVAGYPVWMVMLSFRQDGDRTMLKFVSVTLKDIDVQAAEQAVRERFTATLGEGTELYGTWYWNGKNNTVITTYSGDDYCRITFAVHVPME